MPLQAYFEFGWSNIGWSDVIRLFRAALGPSGLLDVYRRKGSFYISVEALRSDTSREEWIVQARKFDLSDVFIAIAEHGAQKGVATICARMDVELDPELPRRVSQPPKGEVETSRSAAPHRYLVCDEMEHMFHDRYGFEQVRWVADWTEVKIIKVQVYNSVRGAWEDAALAEHNDVVQSVELNGFGEPEETLIECDELPEWAA
jgi:hypothetical protein